MATPTTAELEVSLGTLKQDFGHVLNALASNGTRIPEIAACKKELQHMKETGSPADPDKLEQHYKQLQALNQLAAKYVAHSKEMKASILLFPSQNGGLAAHIRYPSGNNFKVKSAAQETATLIGLKSESNFWGTKIEVYNQNGSALSQEQRETYFSLLNNALKKRGLDSFVGSLPDNSSITAGLTEKAAVGLSSGQTTVGVATAPPLPLGAPGAAAALAAGSPPSPAGSINSRTTTEPGTPRSAAPGE